MYHLLCGLIVFFVWPSEALQGIDCAVLGRDQKAKRSQGSTPRVQVKPEWWGQVPVCSSPSPQCLTRGRLSSGDPDSPSTATKKSQCTLPAAIQETRALGGLERGPSCLSSDCGFICSLSSFASWLGDGLTRRSISISGGQGWEHPCFRRGGRRGSRAGAASTEQEGSEIRMTPRGLVLGMN